MGIFSDPLKKFSKYFDSVIPQVKRFEVMEEWGNSGITEPINKFSDTRSYLTAAQTVTWVGVCNSIIGNDIASAEWHIKDQDSLDVEDFGRDELQLTKLFENPNPYQDFYTFMELSSWFLKLAGNVYWLKDYDNAYQERNFIPARLWLINPSCMAPKVKDGIMLGYALRSKGQETIIPKEEIIHTKLPNPLDSWQGMGLIQANEVLYNTEIAAQYFNWRFFDKGGMPEIALKSDSALSKEQRDELKESYKKKYTGYRKSRGMIILEGGMDIKNVGLNQKDMDFIEQRKFTREEILALHHVPPLRAGVLLGGANYTGKEQDASYWENAVDPELKRWRAKLNLLVKLFRPDWHIDYEPVIKRDIKLDQEVANLRIQNGIFSPNEAREYLGLEKDEDNPAMDERYLPLNLIPMSEAGYTEQTEPGKGFEKKNEFKASRVQLSILRMARNARKKSGRSIRKDMMAYFENQNKEVMAIFNEIFGEKSIKAISQDDAERLIRKLKEQIFGVTATNRLKNTIKKGHTSVLVRAIEDLNATMQTEVDPSFQNPKVSAAISKLGNKITRINETTRLDIEDNIKKAIDAGESIQEMAARLDNIFGKSAYRSEMIARTESAMAYDQGSLLSYLDAGIQYVDVIGCEDDVPDCNAQNIPIDEAGDLEFHPNHTGQIVPRF